MRLADLLTRLYRALLLLYPESHRDRVGDDMADCFHDLIVEAAQGGGWVSALAVAARTFVELPRSALRAHRTEHSSRGGGMETVWQDVRFAARGLVRSPGFTALAVLSLGLGVGANTTMFGMIHGTLWSELPVAEADRLVRLHERRENVSSLSYANYVDVVADAEVFDGAFMHRLETFGLLADDYSQVVHGEIVTPNYFEVLGLDPVLGRFLDPVEHGAPDGPPVAVISHHLWTTTFGSDPAVVGRSIELNETPFTVIGVAPESFHGTKFGIALDLWVPIHPWARADGWFEGWDRSRGNRSLLTVARLADGATLETANAALATLASRLAAAYPEENAGMGLFATAEVAGQIAPGEAGIPNLIGLLAVLGSGLVLLVACGNVASLLLARAVARRREISMRVALGAGRGRLVRQLLTESVMLALLGAAVGTAVAGAVSRVDARLLPAIPYRFAIDTTPDTTTVAFALLASLLAVLVFGLAPALQASSPGVASVLRGDEQAGGLKLSGGRLLNGVVVGVVSLSFVTLFLAGLFVASLRHVRTIDPGFATEGRVMATMDLSLAGMGMADASAFHDELLARIEAIPGVESAAIGSSIPLGDFSSSSTVYADGRSYDVEERGPTAWRTQVTPDWFTTSGIRLLAGRTFTDADGPDAPPVGVVNEALADLLWPDGDPIGRRLRFAREPGGSSIEVVGVIQTGRYSSMIEGPTPALYEPFSQRPRSLAVLMAATAGEPAALVPPMRDAVRAIDPGVALFDVKTSEDHMRNAYWLFRIGAELGLVIGLLAAALAAGGLYGIMAFRVGQRRREMGIRIALGSGRSRVLRLVLVSTLRLVVLGVALGATIALAASGVMESLVFGVEPTSLVHLTGVALALTGLSVAATLAPAVAATRADPVEAIRTE